MEGKHTVTISKTDGTDSVEITTDSSETLDAVMQRYMHQTNWHDPAGYAAADASTLNVLPDRGLSMGDLYPNDPSPRLTVFFNTVNAEPV